MAAAVRSDRIGIPTGLHERRVLAWLRSSAGDALAGRRLWCAASRSGGHAAGRLWNLLKDDLEIDPLVVEATEPALGERVRPGDVVVLHDSFTVSFAAALRDRGAHTVWHLHRRSGSPAPSVRAATDFLDRSGGAAVDAAVLDERSAARNELPPSSPPLGCSTFARCRLATMGHATSGWRSPGSACSATSSRRTGPIASAGPSRRGP